MAHSLANATSRGRCTQPQSGLTARRSAGTISSARRMRSATIAGRLDVVRLHVDDAEAERERRIELLEQLQVLLAAPARTRAMSWWTLRLEDRGEQIAVAALPGRLAVAVAVADVQASCRASTPSTSALTARTRPAAGPRGSPSSRARRSGGRVAPAAHELAQLEVHHAGDVEREGLLARVVLVPDALDQRVRAGDRDLGPPVGEPAQEARILDQPERRRWRSFGRGRRCRRSRSRSASSRDRSARRAAARRSSRSCCRAAARRRRRCRRRRPPDP